MRWLRQKSGFLMPSSKFCLWQHSTITILHKSIHKCLCASQKAFWDLLVVAVPSFMSFLLHKILKREQVLQPDETFEQHIACNHITDQPGIQQSGELMPSWMNNWLMQQGHMEWHFSLECNKEPWLSLQMKDDGTCSHYIYYSAWRKLESTLNDW